MVTRLPAFEDEPRRLPKPLRVLIGVTVMVAVLTAGFGFVATRAGEWGVPYFSFTAPGGTECTNTWMGHACEHITVRDFERWSDLRLPEGTTLTTGSYTEDAVTTQVVATLRTDADHAGEFLDLLKERYGDCQPGGVAPAELSEHSKVCMATSTRARGKQAEAMTRSWSFSTGVAEDGTRLTLLTVGS